MVSEGLIPRELRGVFRRMGISLEIAAALMILFGILISIFPALVALLVGLYLVVAGIVTLLGHIGGPKREERTEAPGLT